MNDRKPLNDFEKKSRSDLIFIAQKMLNKEVSFFEGAVQIVALRSQIGGVSVQDADFNVFLLIQSETDHLPLKEQHALWSKDALRSLEPDFEHTEKWASSFAPQACINLIARFREPE